MGVDKNSPQITRPMSQSQLQKSHTNTNRQDNVVMDQLQVLGTIPWNTRGSTWEEAKELIKLGKNQRTDRTVRLAAADCPLEKGRTVHKTGRGRSAVQKLPPTEKQHFYLNVPPNGPRGVADCPPSTRGRSVDELRRKTANPQEHLHKVVPGSPNWLKLLSQDLGEMICVTRWCYAPKFLASNTLECQESRITRTQPRTKNSTQRPSNRGGFPAFEGSRSSTKRHKALTHNPLKEIRRKTLSNPRNQPKNENTKEALKRPTKTTTPSLLYNQERFVQGLACLLNIHPSLKISPWSSQASLMEILEKTGRENRKTKWARVSRDGCHPLSSKYIWRHPKD
jgi:hypothetical protein